MKLLKILLVVLILVLVGLVLTGYFSPIKKEDELIAQQYPSVQNNQYQLKPLQEILPPGLVAPFTSSQIIFRECGMENPLKYLYAEYDISRFEKMSRKISRSLGVEYRLVSVLDCGDKYLVETWSNGTILYGPFSK